MSDPYDLADDSPHRADSSERTKSGQPIYRYDHPPEEGDFATGDSTLIDAISSHIEKHLADGQETSVFHEIVSTTIHVDIHFVPPTSARPFITLVTSGMAERPMTRPRGVEGCEFAELVVCLPPDWPGLSERERMMDPSDKDNPFGREENYWPIRWMKMLSRFPHEYKTWLWEGHTMPNGDPAEPFAPNTALSGWMLTANPLMPEGFETLRVGDRDIAFLTLMPLHADEMQFKLDHGAEALLKLFDAHRVSPVIHPARPSVMRNTTPVSRPKRPWWRFW